MTTVELAPEESPIVVRDVHPAKVLLDHDMGEFGAETVARWDRARVVLTRERLYVWTDRGRPVLAFAAPYERDGLILPARGASRGKAWRVPTSEGVVIVHPSGGCGCGSVLKAWQPFRPMRRGELD